MTRIAISLILAIATALHAHAELAPLDSSDAQAEWRPLFEKMAEKGSIRSEFTERRWLAVRPEPIQLQGELRFSPGLGLSLHYSEPEDQTVVVDDRGIVMRNAKGRTRSLKSGNRAAAVIQAMLTVMRFDFDRLIEEFSIAAARDSDTWTIGLTPKSADLTKSLGVLQITGCGEVVQSLEFIRSESQRIEIVVDETETGVTFSEEEMRKFFR